VAVNLGLALDDKEWIDKEAVFIQRLRFCVQEMPGYVGSDLLTRGLDMSPEEAKSMKSQGRFYLPGFVSTTLDAAPPGAFKKNTILRIDASQGERVTLDIANSPDHVKRKLTPYPNQREVLIQCYSLFEFVDMIEGEDGKPREIFLRLLDPLNEHDEMLELYMKAKQGRWREVFEALNGQPHKARVCVKYWKPTSGWTMLHQAAFWGDQPAASMLLDLGADIHRAAWYNQHGDDAEPCYADQVENEHGTKIQLPCRNARAGGSEPAHRS